MKIIKINESQRKRLFEAYSEGFSFEELTMIGNGQFAGEDNSEAQYEYCQKYLGNPIDNGSSRAVFQLNDKFVLKLSLGYDGFMQNEREYKLTTAINSELLTKVVYCADDYSYIVSEYAVPATYEDFEKILGIPYSDMYFQKTKKRTDPHSRNKGDIEIGFDKYFDNIKPYKMKSDISYQEILYYIAKYKSDYDFYQPYDPKLSDKYEDIIQHTPWLTKLRELINNNKLDPLDLLMSNLGIVNRDGNPTIVILDSGMNDNEKYEFENNY